MGVERVGDGGAVPLGDYVCGRLIKDDDSEDMGDLPSSLGRMPSLFCISTEIDL